MLNVVNFGEEYKKPVVLCLGHYESIHKGHAEIIKNAEKLKNSLGAEVMLMTIKKGDNLRKRGVILTFEERVKVVYSYGVGSVLAIDFTEEFKNLSPESFLEILTSTLNVKGFACGFDFRFGKDRKGNIDLLKNFADKKNLPLIIEQKVEFDGQKISTSSIKELIEEGRIEKANTLLGYNFFIEGIVQEGRKQGRLLGFPTANIVVPDGRLCVKNGVYEVQSTLNGVRKKGIANVGVAPTFSFYTNIVEVHFKDFNGNLYGEKIKVEFVRHIRDTVKFSSIEELKKQLQKDIDGIKG